MTKQVKEKLNRNKQIALVVISILVIILVVVFITKISQPERSVSNYCKIYSQEKARLSAMSKDSNTYTSGVFNVSIDDASQIAQSFRELSKVAPEEIRSTTNRLGELYQDIYDNPSHLIENTLSGGSLDDNLKEWSQQQCSK